MTSVCMCGSLLRLEAEVVTSFITIIGSVRKNSGGKRQAYYQSQVITGKRRSLSALEILLIRYLSGQTSNRGCAASQ